MRRTRIGWPPVRNTYSEYKYYYYKVLRTSQIVKEVGLKLKDLVSGFTP